MWARVVIQASWAWAGARPAFVSAGRAAGGQGAGALGA